MTACSYCPPKYQGLRQPRNNCDTCWDYFLKNNPGRVLAVETGLKTVGFAKVESVTGTKFLKQYERFKEKQNASQKEV